MTVKVFISYRREDSAGYAGRVHDRLEREFGRDVLFMDVDAIPLGAHFVKFIREEVIKCGVLLAVIGPNWLDARDGAGNRRLQDPNDFVRTEIATALEYEIPVIPVLLDGTLVPKAVELPADLSSLAQYNGLNVRHASFHSDMDKLVGGLKRYLQNVDKPSDRKTSSGNQQNLDKATIRRPDNDAEVPIPQQNKVEAKRRANEIIRQIQSPTEDYSETGSNTANAFNNFIGRLIQSKPLIEVFDNLPILRQHSSQLFRILVVGEIVAGLTLIWFGNPLLDSFVGQSLGGALIISGTIAISSALTVTGLTANRAAVSWAMAIMMIGAGAILLRRGIQLDKYALGDVLIVTGTIALCGGIVNVGSAADHRSVHFLIAIVVSIIGVMLIGFGIPINDFPLGNTLITCGMILFSVALLELSVAVNKVGAYVATAIISGLVGLVLIAFALRATEVGSERVLFISGVLAMEVSFLSFAITPSTARRITWLAPLVGGLVLIASGIAYSKVALSPALIVGGAIALIGSLAVVKMRLAKANAQ